MRAKIQHYVPQFYLRYFSKRQKKGYFVYCFDKATGKIFHPNVKNIAAEKEFYDYYTSDGEKQSIEEFLSNLETKAQIAFQNIFENPSAEALFRNQETFAQFISFQEKRTTVFRTTEKDMIQKANDRLEQEGFSFNIPTKNDSKEFQARFLLESIPQFVKVMLEMKWILVINKTGMPFWTSDNPVFRYNPHKADLVGNLGLQNPGIQLHFPFSPNLAIIVCDPLEYQWMESMVEAHPTNIDFNNSGQVISSQQYLFSNNNDYQLVKDMLVKDPQLAQPDRSSMQVN